MAQGIDIQKLMDALLKRLQAEARYEPGSFGIRRTVEEPSKAELLAYKTKLDAIVSAGNTALHDVNNLLLYYEED